jgi:hypothetical protein
MSIDCPVEINTPEIGIDLSTILVARLEAEYVKTTVDVYDIVITVVPYNVICA